MEEVKSLSTEKKRIYALNIQDKTSHFDPSPVLVQDDHEDNDEELEHLTRPQITMGTKTNISGTTCTSIIYTPNKDTFLYPYLPTPYLDRLYPTDVPRSVQLLRQENIAVPACYLCVGLLQGKL